ncbi:MAG: thiol peroxidase [bacterium]|nr:thiol peroxidase [bacterium]
MERENIVTINGNALTLVGPDVKEGDTAPDFTVLNGDLAPVKFSDFAGRVVIISAVPSLDTPVCELQTKRFNAEASKMEAKILTISMDLPFAQQRFCESFSIENVQILSDFKDREFAHAYGLYIKELGLIARSIFVIGKDGKIAYREIVSEVGEHPNYDKALEEAKKL